MLKQKEKDEAEKRYSYGICKAEEVDTEQRTVVAIVSTGVVDRQKEVLKPSGVLLDNFVKNPVVPWSHNSQDPPIGKALWVKKGYKRVLAKVKFAATERAEEVWQLFKQGFLNAFSVGFIPVKGHRPTPDEIKKSPELAEARFIYDEWELLEFSPVTIPANPEALSQAIKAHKIEISEDLQKQLEIPILTDDEDEDDDEPGAELLEDDIEVSIPVRYMSTDKGIEVEPVFSLDNDENSDTVNRYS